MAIDKNLLGPCGLYCGVCGILIAHREGNLKFKEKLSAVYHVPVEDLTCDGCLSDTVFKYCQVCPIKSCNRERGFEGCHQCSDFPCGHVDRFPMAVGKKAIMRAVPERKKLSAEAWVAAEEKLYRCPACDGPFFRGAKRCRACKQPVDQD